MEAGSVKTFGVKFLFRQMGEGRLLHSKRLRIMKVLSIEVSIDDERLLERMNNDKCPQFRLFGLAKEMGWSKTSVGASFRTGR